MRAIQIHEFGGPEVLILRDIEPPAPSAREVLIDVTVAGVNFADTHQAENSYLAPSTLPMVPGIEVAGMTPDGRRVVALLDGGGYAEQASAPIDRVWEIPDAVSDREAVAVVLQGATAWHLLRTSTGLRPGETVVVHAAAGGVGTLAVQLAKRWGAGLVIATASSADKRQLALDLGADVAIDSRQQNMKTALEQANGGRKVDVVLEMVGGQTFDTSLAALARFGRLVTYGMAGRVPPQPVDPVALMHRSRAVVGFWLNNCFDAPGMLDAAIGDLLGMLAERELRPVLGGEYPLAHARSAHENLRGRETVGKLVLTNQLAGDEQ
jgi:NADPH:quinone reductase